MYIRKTTHTTTLYDHSSEVVVVCSFHACQEGKCRVVLNPRENTRLDSPPGPGHGDADLLSSRSRVQYMFFCARVRNTWNKNVTALGSIPSAPRSEQCAPPLGPAVWPHLLFQEALTTKTQTRAASFGPPFFHPSAFPSVALLQATHRHELGTEPASTQPNLRTHDSSV